IYMLLTNKFLFCYSCVTQNLNVRYKYLYIKDIKFVLIFKGNKLEELTIEEGPNMVGNYAFNNTALRKLVYPGSLGRLPGLYSPSLEELKLGEGIIEINEVLDGGKLKEMIFPKSLKIISKCQLNAIDGKLTLGPNIKEINLSFQTPQFSELTISGKSAKIWGSFDDCEALENVDLSGVKTVETSFGVCPSLIGIKLGDIDRIDSSFNHLQNLRQLHIPGSCKEVVGSFRDATSIEVLKIDEGVESIERSFYGAENLKVLYIPSSLSLALSLSRNKLEEVHLTSSMPVGECPKYIQHPLKLIN
ncbi:MAG: leucine-rich repeat domain-containing protein, partial [Muribaculaceae bacterium]|nr:leucine-rich repeat domain-containing protein [Muribaculaceae bacterium]